MFMENVWLIEPGLESSQNMTACKNKASRTRERIFFAILRTQEYMRACGRSLATDSHKYAKQTKNSSNIDEVHPPP